ncbi:DUF1176 domain-containing protein [Acinetobacter sp. SCLZS86]|uniref:DUF1176 domain-containing protein n=1 Tax=Acinetobacter sp. SCLZS86 TaxID=2908637 RepID=UPI001F2DBC8D|nr:DUF1176 domain-containing protein [Acinetobacter sp. SCLZS86]UIZ58138.1 DUF1176 domain-containing protein [Acinetobacter sp. SCLZS86]
MNFRCNLKILLAISGLFGSVGIFAAPITAEKTIASSQSTALQGLYFQHQDWELACDNTGTCRAAGYQSDDDFEQPISMLLTRQEGAKSAVQGQLQIQEDIAQATLFLNGRTLQQLNFHESIANLSAASVQKLLAQARQHAVIELKHGQQRWKLSDAGMSAVLLKMDEFQKRVGTDSAILAKGNQASTQVLKAQAMPKINILMQPQHRTAKAQVLTAASAEKLYPILQKTVDREDCYMLFEPEQAEQQIHTYPLNQDRVLVEANCWRGAYNWGVAYWVMDKKLQKIQQFVTDSASEFSNGQIFSYQKGRGIGDCFSQIEWAWNGQQFVKSYQFDAGQCKGFAGSAWDMPSFVSKVE